jgi:DNA gyrase subunit A
MATNIPPHNLREVIDACVSMVDNPDIDIEQLMQIVPGPDFPTAGIISGIGGIREAYRTGRGRIYVRARVQIEGEEDYQRLIVTELPYQVNKARLIEKIAELHKEKRIEGIRNDGLRDESDKDGMRIVIELKRGEVAEVVLNNLYKHTQMQEVYGINTVALVNGQPRTLNLRQLIDAFLRHRREVVTKRTVYDLRKARERAHKLEGLAVALTNVDPVIELIKASPTPADAKEGLMARAWPPGIVVQMLARAGAGSSRPDGLADGLGMTAEGYRLSEVQAQEILDLKLQRLTGLEKDKIMTEYEEVLVNIADLADILARPERLMRVIRDELTDIRERYGDDRRTEIVHDHQDLNDEDLIAPEDVVVTLSHAGYAKSQPIDVYRSQRRGGRGRTAATTREEDFVEKLFIANTHDTVLCFSTRGRLYWLKVYQLPQAGPQARGKPLVNLLPLVEGERITAVLPIKEFSDTHNVFMATRQGIVKKTPLSEYSRPRPSGIIAVDLPEDDDLVGVALTDGRQDVMLFRNDGKAIRFNEDDVRPMGRVARGVRGMRLDEGESHRVIALIIVEPNTSILTATANGYGKRTPIDDYPVQGRGGQGVISIQTTERNGEVVGAIAVATTDEVMLISQGGTLVRTPAAGISEMGRNTQGVRLINLDEGENLIGVERIVEGSGDDSGNGDDGADEASS